MKIFIINGPNINLLGVREPEIYGLETYDGLLDLIKQVCFNEKISYEIYQSNVEGELVNYIQKAYFEKADGIIINPAAYTHTSIAILDALKAIKIPTIEVHISDIDNREDFRKKSLISPICVKTIKGKGINGYKEAILELKKVIEG